MLKMLCWVYAPRGAIVGSITTANIISTIKRESIWLFTLSDALACGRIKENVWVIGRVLSLYEVIQLGIIWCLLTKYRVTKDWRIRSEVLNQKISIRILYITSSEHTGGVFFSDLRYS